MSDKKHTIIIGSGPSAIYFLKHLLDRILSDEVENEETQQLTIIEQREEMGTGMPWSGKVAKPYHLANIEAKALPKLPQMMVDWLEAQDQSLLDEFDLQKAEIDGSTLYPRILVGYYYQAQYRNLVDALRAEMCEVSEVSSTEVVDIELVGENEVKVSTDTGVVYSSDRVLIASGHSFPDEDRVAEGYYSSPWPIGKILPDAGSSYSFEIGILGASLSAFDVISAISRSHGEFLEGEDGLEFHANEGIGDFKITMHAGDGWLPQLEYEEKKLTRKIFRYVSFEELSEMRNNDGFLRLDDYFDRVCRGALLEAAEDDGLEDLAELLKSDQNGMEEFIELMSHKHDYDNPFDGMRKELVEAKKLQQSDTATSWKETFDDLIYCLNYHCAWMPYEDHLRLKKTVFPFLLNMVAGLPLESAKLLLALERAGFLKLETGMVTVQDAECENQTTVKISNNGDEYTKNYRLFVDCSGQGPVELRDYPFPSLVKAGSVRAARVAIAGNADSLPDLGLDSDDLIKSGDKIYAIIPGIDIDENYRIIRESGECDGRLYDIAFPHAMGLRPYSFGLQSCSDATEIVVKSWDEVRKCH